MINAKLGIMALVVLVLSACAPATITKKQAFPEMYEKKPVSLLVLPPINQSTAAEAKDYFNSTIAEPLTMKGYYVYPLEVVSELLASEGFPDTELLLNVPATKFRETFGADAVMFITINSWNTTYIVLGGSVTVALTFDLKSTLTGETIWRYKDSLTVDTSGGNSGPGMAGLLLKAVATAIKTATTDYVPIARQLNYIATTGLPAGKYHPLNNKDMEDKVISNKVTVKAN